MSVYDFLNPLQNIKPKFTEDQLSEIINFFDDKAKPLLTVSDELILNVITIEHFKQFLALKKFHRRSFHYPSYGEIMLKAEKLNAGTSKMLTKEQFIYMLNKWVLEPKLKHELKLAFKVFDTEKRDFLDIGEIQTIVTSYGDIFDVNETRELLRDANVRGDGNVFYADFVESMLSLAPELNELKVEYLYENPDEDPSVEPEPEPAPVPEAEFEPLQLTGSSNIPSTPPVLPPPTVAKKKGKK